MKYLKIFCFKRRGNIIRIRKVAINVQYLADLKNISLDMFYYFHFFYDTESHIYQDGLTLNKLLKMT